MSKGENYRFRLNDFKNQLELHFLEKIENRKLIAYGATSRWKEINKVINIEDLVEFFVDRNPDRWGEFYYGKEIKTPDALTNLDTTKYAVVVSTAWFEEVSRVLDKYGLVKNVDYFNFFQYVHVGFPFGSFNTLIRFLDSVPDEMRHIIADKTKSRIGVVMNVESLNTDVTDVPFSVALFLILKWKGYDVKLIVDYLQWDGDIIQYEGRCHACNLITDQIVDKLKDVVPESDIMYINYQGKHGAISAQDTKKCERIAECGANWSTWHRSYYGRFIPVELLQKELSKIFKRNLPYIDAFFEENHFDVINASTALHKRAGIFNYVAEKKNIRVASEDGYDKESMLICANGPASCAMDIPRVFEENWIKETKEERIRKKAVQMWEKRRRLTISTNEEELNLDVYRKSVREKGYAYMAFQSPCTVVERSYDVVIPLNIRCDGEALIAETIFGSFEQWLIQTLDFVINKLGKSVLIREHPSTRYHKDYKSTEICDLYPEILDPYKGNDLLLYMKSDEDLNLYQYMERCKIVIPWTSTAGMEAGIMKKDVLVHTDVFYKDGNFVKRAYSRAEYFDFLSKSLLDENQLKQENDEALKYFYYSMARRMITKFTIFHSNTFPWQFECFKELLEEEGVEEVIQIVAENIPSTYLIEKQHKRIYDL